MCFILKNEDIHRLDEQVAEKERILKASTTKIAQVDENLLQIEEQLEKLRLQRIQKEAENDELQMKKER